MKYTGQIFLVIGSLGLGITLVVKALEVYLLHFSEILWPYAFIWVIIIVLGSIMYWKGKSHHKS